MKSKTRIIVSFGFQQETHPMHIDSLSPSGRDGRLFRVIVGEDESPAARFNVAVSGTQLAQLEGLGITVPVSDNDWAKVIREYLERGSHLERALDEAREKRGEDLYEIDLREGQLRWAL